MTKSPTSPEKEGCRERIGSVQRHRGLSHSASSEPECEPSRSARSSHIPEPCSPNTGLPSHVTTTCEPSPPIASGQMELLPISFAEDSRARTSVRPERARASLTERAAAYGQNTPELLAKFDPASSSWRTSQHCLIEGLTEFSETWPRSGMMQNGIAYELPTLAPRTYGTGFGSSPTHSIPTPTASDYIERFCTSSEMLNFETNKSVSLDRWVMRWPMPIARDYRSPGRSRLERTGSKAGECLPQAIGGQLNPTWVEWLMGFPLGWTALKDWAMPSFRKFRKSSGEQS